MIRSTGRTVSLTIDSIASGGDGVGRFEGMVVFVPRTAPGDVVTASVSGNGHFMRGRLRALVQPSPARVDPECPHYVGDRCGGCQIQHIDYESQLAAKQQMIVDAMQRIGKRRVDLPTIVPSGARWRYRTTLTLALRMQGDRWIAGLHTFDDPAKIFHLRDCPITHEDVILAWKSVMAAAEFFPNEPDLRGSVRLTSGGPTFTLLGGHRWPHHDDFFERVPAIAALYWKPTDQPRVVLADRRATEDQVPGASFAQVNPSVATALRSHVLERVLAHTPTSVVDAYAGNGDLAAELASKDIQVTTIELDADAVEWSRERLPESAVTVRGRVEDVLPDYLPTDVLVLNPPRTGLHADVPTALQQQSPPRAVVYISCDPATLARDVSRLSHYRITSLVAFDMFPQTSHVETVCELVPEAA